MIKLTKSPKTMEIESDVQSLIRSTKVAIDCNMNTKQVQKLYVKAYNKFNQLDKINNCQKKSKKGFKGLVKKIHSLQQKKASKNRKKNIKLLLGQMLDLQKKVAAYRIKKDSELTVKWNKKKNELNSTIESINEFITNQDTNGALDQLDIFEPKLNKLRKYASKFGLLSGIHKETISTYESTLETLQKEISQIQLDQLAAREVEKKHYHNVAKICTTIAVSVIGIAVYLLW